MERSLFEGFGLIFYNRRSVFVLVKQDPILNMRRLLPFISEALTLNLKSKEVVVGR